MKSSAEVTQTGGRVGRQRGSLPEYFTVTYESPPSPPAMPCTSEGTQGKFLCPEAVSRDPRPPAVTSAALALPQGQLSGPAVSGGGTCLRCASVNPGRGCSAQQDPQGRRVTEGSHESGVSSLGLPPKTTQTDNRVRWCDGGT